MLGTAQRTQMLAQEGLLAQVVKACSRVFERSQKWNLDMTPGECAPMFQAASLLIRRCGPNPNPQTLSFSAWSQSSAHLSGGLPPAAVRPQPENLKCFMQGMGLFMAGFQGSCSR